MSEHNLELYYYEECPYCIRVVKLIKELKIVVTYKNTRLDASNLEFHMKTTGKSQVPCLYIDGKPMFESSDIMNWLKANEQNLKKLA